MSVLVKGMKMPKGCYECPLLDGEYGGCKAGATGEYDPYCEDCPLEDLNVLCALADRACPFQGKEFVWCLTCPHISEEDRNLIKKVVQEPKTGEWLEVEVFPEVYDIEGVKTWGSEMQCDQCGFRFTAIEGHITQYNFCPNCGARMNGGEEE